MVNLTVVLELGNIVYRGFDSENETELVIHLDGECTHVVFYPRSENAGIEVISHFALVVPVEFPPQEGGDVIRLD
ncbi:MAG: hypothetical protein DDT27_01640 [Dehalococcoidia bacterium]|nr:hypothetical protein [Chloroflexota bacterium]